MSTRSLGTAALALLAIGAYGLRFGASWLLLQWVPAGQFDPHGFGLLGDAIELGALALPLGGLLWWVLRRRGPWAGMLAPAGSPGRTVLSVVLLLIIGAPTVGQVWTMVLLPLSASWPVAVAAVVWFALVAVLRALAATGGPANSPTTPWADTVATSLMLTVTAVPFVIFFPQPPAFGRAGAGIVAAAMILGTAGTTVRAGGPQRRRAVRRSATLLVITATSIVLRILLAGDRMLALPMLDLIPKLFGLEGEDVNDAVLYEGWLELWLACAVAFGAGIYLAARLRPAATHPKL